MSSLILGEGYLGTLRGDSNICFTEQDLTSGAAMVLVIYKEAFDWPQAEIDLCKEKLLAVSPEKAQHIKKIMLFLATNEQKLSVSAIKLWRSRGAYKIEFTH